MAAAAAPPALSLPLACTPNRDCWIANHVDLDTEGVRRGAAAWTPGVYRGEARLVRADGSRSPASGQAASVEVKQ